VTGTPDRLLVDVLGPIRARRADGTDVTPSGVLQRRLLALLVMRRGRVVSVEAATDALWPADPPREPIAALHNHVFRLRRSLPDGVIDSTGDGYLVVPSRIDVDADRLAAVLNASGASDPGGLRTIDEILERWHGPAYPELDDLHDGLAEAVRLEELRTRAREVRAQWRLVARDTDGLVVDVAALADEEPLRERPRALLMSALAAAGRTVEALRVYDDFRRLIGAELGIEPSPALVAQHAELLAGSGVAAWTPSTRLPVPATSLVGRDTLVADVSALVDTTRLVTLVGPGGVGKTRSLVEVGHRLSAARPDRPVVMCELATANEESAVDVVAATLGIEPRAGVPIADRVAAVLTDVEILLLLDNCEHVLDPVADLVERLLATCPDVHVAATSRERLRVPGEHVCTVPTLPASTDGPAVRLFVERARAVSPGFEPDPGALIAISEVVRRLDGLPLAIELAAARLHTHDVAEVAAGLDDRFRLLSTGYRASSRHRSLGAALAWSFDLLDARLQRIFVDLSVFVGPFSAADAAVICDVDVDSATGALHQLGERSLLTRTADRRFALLETVRAFAAEHLDAQGRSELVGERHARHELDWIVQADGELLGDPGPDGLARIDAAIAELRSALDWFVDHGAYEPAGRLVATLLNYGFFRPRPDVLAWADRVSSADPDDSSPLAPLVWVSGAYAAWMAGDVAENGARADRALRASERLGAVPGRVANVCGNHALFMGRLDDAVDWYRRTIATSADDPAQRLIASGTEALALAYAGHPSAVEVAERVLSEIGDSRTPYSAYAWFCAGEANMSVDVERARACLARALQVAELTNATFVTQLAVASMASIDARMGDPLAAAAEYRQLIAQWRGAGVWSTQWTLLRSIAALLARIGRQRDAAVLEGAVRATRAGHQLFGADEAALDELGAQLRADLGDGAYEAARSEGATLDGDAVVEHVLHALREL
jgi:predicted ATPase/DNA-binding SARP family transcriptional activator